MPSCVIVNKLGGCLSGGLLDGVELGFCVEKWGLWNWAGLSSNPGVSCLAVLWLQANSQFPFFFPQKSTHALGY